MTDDEVARVAEGLSGRQGDALRVALPRWFAAIDVGFTGNTMSILADKGLLERRSDPETWGRGQYRLNGEGMAVRQHLIANPKD